MRAIVSTGIAIQIPPGSIGLLKSVLPVSFKYGIEVGAGVISGDFFPKPIKVMLHNHSNKVTNIPKPCLIAHLLIIPVLTPEVTEIHTDAAISEHVEEDVEEIMNAFLE